MVEGKGTGPTTFLVEHKLTTKQSLTLQGSWLSKITKEALENGRQPALCVVIGGERWYMVPEYIFNALLEE